MSNPTQDEKRAALEAAGYTPSHELGNRIWFSPDASVAFTAPFGAESIDQAYAHMMQQQELEALRELVHTIASLEYGQSNADAIIEMAQDAILQYGIGDDDD